jgi:hypothetical protein
MSKKTLTLELNAVEAATVVTALFRLHQAAEKHAKEASEKGDVRTVVGALQAHVITMDLIQRIEEDVEALMQAEEEEEEATAG